VAGALGVLALLAVQKWNGVFSQRPWALVFYLVLRACQVSLANTEAEAAWLSEFSLLLLVTGNGCVCVCVCVCVVWLEARGEIVAGEGAGVDRPRRWVAKVFKSFGLIAFSLRLSWSQPDPILVAYPFFCPKSPSPFQPPSWVPWVIVVRFITRRTVGSPFAAFGEGPHGVCVTYGRGKNSRNMQHLPPAVLRRFLLIYSARWHTFDPYGFDFLKNSKPPNIPLPS